MVKFHNPNSETMCNILMNRNPASRLLGELRDHHIVSYDHSIRVGELSTDLGFENGFDESEIMHICSGGLLHDVGKIFILNVILDNVGNLTPYQVDVIRTHPANGFQLLNEHKLYLEACVALTHHHYKKNPYPLSDISIPDEAKEMAEIVAAADIFDAIRNKRYYEAAVACNDIENKMKGEYTGNPKYLEQILERCE